MGLRTRTEAPAQLRGRGFGYQGLQPELRQADALAPRGVPQPHGCLHRMLVLSPLPSAPQTFFFNVFESPAELFDAPIFIMVSRSGSSPGGRSPHPLPTLPGDPSLLHLGAALTALPSPPAGGGFSLVPGGFGARGVSGKARASSPPIPASGARSVLELACFPLCFSQMDVETIYSEPSEFSSWGCLLRWGLISLGDSFLGSYLLLRDSGIAALPRGCCSSNISSQPCPEAVPRDRSTLCCLNSAVVAGEGVTRPPGHPGGAWCDSTSTSHRRWAKP